MSFVAGAIIGGAVIGGVASAYGSNKAAGAAADASRESVAEQRRQFDLARGDQAPYRALGNNALASISRLYGYAPATEPVPAAQFDPQANWLASIPAGAGGIYGNLLGRIGEQVRTQQGAPLPGWQPIAPPASAPAGPDLSVFWESPDYRFNLGEGQRAIDRSLASRGRALSGAGVREGIRYASGMASNEFGNFYNRLASQAGIGQSSVNATGQMGMQTAGNIGNALMQAGNTRANAYMQGAQGVNNAIQGGIGNWLYGKGWGMF